MCLHVSHKLFLMSKNVFKLFYFCYELNFYIHYGQVSAKKTNKTYLWNRNWISLLYLNASSNYNTGLCLMQFFSLFKPRIRSFKFKWTYYLVYLKMQSQIQLNTTNFKNCHHFWGWIIFLPAMGESLQSLSPATNIIQPRGTNSAELLNADIVQLVWLRVICANEAQGLFISIKFLGLKWAEELKDQRTVTCMGLMNSEKGGKRWQLTTPIQKWWS